MDLRDKAVQLRELVDVRAELEGALKSVKEQEQSIKEEIIEYFQLGNQQSANFPGVGTLALRRKTTVTISDAEKVCAFMYEKMKEADANGLPLTNALVLHRRASQTEMLAWAQERLAEANLPDDAQSFNQVLGPVGFLYLTDTDLQLTKSKEN
jgi:hypothetical protein